MTVNDEKGRTWKEGVVAYFKVLPQNLSVGSRDIYETLSEQLISVLNMKPQDIMTTKLEG